MPFINGKFYMNPAYGRALERLRVRSSGEEDAEPQEVSASDADEGHWVTINHRHVFIHDGPARQMQLPRAEVERRAEVGYGETAGILPAAKEGANGSPYDRGEWDPNSARSLQQARINIMDISTRNGTVRRDRPNDPRNSVQQSVWQDNIAAASQSQGDMPGNYFFIRQEGKGPQRPPKSAGFGQGKPIREYGPFRNVGGGDVPPGDRTYIDIYYK